MRLLSALLVFMLISFSSHSQNALDFDGADDYVLSNYNGISGNSARTIEAWIKTTAVCDPNSGGSQQVIVDWGTFVTGGRFTFNVLWNNSIRIEVGGNGLSGTTAVNDGQWHHVAVSYNPSASNQYKLYIDGALETEGNLTVSTNTVLGTPVTIGRRIDNIKYFDGTIDEVRVWNTTRTASQINASRKNEFCSAPAGMVAYYKFNQGIASGNNQGITSVTDFSSTSATANLNGFSLNGASSNWVLGPDSLSVGQTSGSNLQLSACAPYQSPSGNFTWTTSGTYTDTVQSVAGCDSVITIQLHILPNTYDSISPTACNGYTSPSGKVWTTSGAYIDTIGNAAGCDSIVYIDLQVIDIDTSVAGGVFFLECQHNTSTATYLWLDCNQNFQPAIGQGSDSYSFLPHADGSYACIISDGGCTDTTACHDVVGVGIEEATNPLFLTLQPNPASGYVLLDFQFVQEEIVIELLALNGQSIRVAREKNRSDFRLDLANVEAGVYMLRVQAADAVVIQKLVVE